MRVVDAVLAVDESELFQFRISYLATCVDQFVVGESRFAFDGLPKPMLFSELKSRGELPDNVSICEIEFPDELLRQDSRFELEFFARDFLARWTFDRYPGSMIMIQDIDEIPSRDQIVNISRLPQEDYIASIPMFMGFRAANWELTLKKKGWFTPKVFYGEPPSRNIRTFFTRYQIRGERGAHLAFLAMNATKQKIKFERYGHQEFNRPAIWTDEFLEYCNLYGLDHLGRAHREGFGLLRRIPTNRLPEVCRAAIAEHPEWAGSNFSGSFIERIVRAQFVRQFVMGTSAPSPKTSMPWAPTLRGTPKVLLLVLTQVSARILNIVWNRVRKKVRRLLRLGPIFMRAISPR